MTSEKPKAWLKTSKPSIADIHQFPPKVVLCDHCKSTYVNLIGLASVSISGHMTTMEGYSCLSCGCIFDVYIDNRNWILYSNNVGA